MLNMVPISELTGTPIPIGCPICHEMLGSDQAKQAHLQRVHPNWATMLMSAFLRQVPRENG